MENEEQILVKYCFTELKNEFTNGKDIYYSTIITELESEGIIRNICTYESESPFDGDGDKIVTIYQIEACEKYAYSFYCNEIRKDRTETFNFTIKFVFETHDAAEILYVEICSSDYTFTTKSDSNCLEVLKHKLRSKINGWGNRYCLIDKQSAFYASNLYPRIYEIENFFRYYVNDVFIKVFGENWWNETVAANIKKNRKNRIDDTREYAGAYKDIQPYLLSLELGDLMTIANTKTLKWTPTYDVKIESVLNHYSDSDLISLLKSQCQIKVDIWNICFRKHLSDDFESSYETFEKRRNQIAHNKLLDYDAFKNIAELCEKIMQELTTAHTKFCEEFISDEEKEMIEEYKADLAEQEAMEREAMNSIAESESNVKVYSQDQIANLFNHTLYILYNELILIFDERQDIEFSEYSDIKNITSRQQSFQIAHKIKGSIISIFVELDITDLQGETSELKVICGLDEHTKECVISFVNGEYRYNSEQMTYMPEIQDELNEVSVEETKQDLCDFIEKYLPNLREEADIKNHLDVMGKSYSITERDVFCCECGEEYICIDEAYAPVGTCLNCGAKNYIMYCTYCQCPIEAVDIDDKDEEQYYCSNCSEELFGED